QFHPEVTVDMVDLWTTRGEAKLSWKGAQSKTEQLAKSALYDEAIAQWTERFLDRWLHDHPAAAPAPMTEYVGVRGAA
ncbi:MAG: hypothetical protein AAFY15_07685, partial [Cyanobacteria bacterium J06648_11]